MIALSKESKVTVYGYSDDIIVLDGGISENFYPPWEGVVVFSNGVILEYEYEGDWKFSIKHVPDDADVSMYPAGSTTAKELADCDYTDVVCFDTGDVPVWAMAAGDRHEVKKFREKSEEGGN